MRDWVSEIQGRMKSAGNACAVLELCRHELHAGIDEDIRMLEYSNHLPEGLKVRQELLANMEDVLRTCTDYGEYQEMKFEQEMEGNISRLERMK